MLICGGSGFGESAQVEYVLARDYCSVVQRELGKARSSVTVALYSFTLRPQLSDSPVFALSQSLKLAHDRGVRVEGGADLSEGKKASAFAGMTVEGA